MAIFILTPLTKFAVSVITFSKRMEAQEQKTKEIEQNYLARFENLKDHVSCTEKNVIDRIYQSEIRIINQINSNK